MATLVIDNDVVKGHSLYKDCGSLLSVLSERDYGNNYFKDSVVCLDGDGLETIQAMKCKREKKHTVDAVIGIADYVNNSMRSERLQLVELRLGYKTTKHLNATDLTMKVTHSVEMLGGEVSIDETVLFVFDDSMKQRARRWFSDLNNGSGGKYGKALP